MNLTSLTSQGIVFWRIFNQNESVYAVGDGEGVLSPGATATINHPDRIFQREIKRGQDVFGPFLVRAGRKFRNNENLLLDHDGQLVELTEQIQVNWRWCSKCSILFFSSGQDAAGTCPVGGQHDGTVSGRYILAHNTRTPWSQPDWRWCHKCSGLFFANGQSTAGKCPAGGAHEKGISGNYTPFLNAGANVAGQSKWRWCHKCSGLFHAGIQQTTGRCPADGMEHSSQPSGDYTLMHLP